MWSRPPDWQSKPLFQLNKNRSLTRLTELGLPFHFHQGLLLSQDFLTGLNDGLYHPLPQICKKVTTHPQQPFCRISHHRHIQKVSRASVISDHCRFLPNVWRWPDRCHCKPTWLLRLSQSKDHIFWNRISNCRQLSSDSTRIFSWPPNRWPHMVPSRSDTSYRRTSLRRASMDNVRNSRGHRSGTKIFSPSLWIHQW